MSAGIDQTKWRCIGGPQWHWCYQLDVFYIHVFVPLSEPGCLLTASHTGEHEEASCRSMICHHTSIKPIHPLHCLKMHSCFSRSVMIFNHAPLTVTLNFELICFGGETPWRHCCLYSPLTHSPFHLVLTTFTSSLGRTCIIIRLFALIVSPPGVMCQRSAGDVNYCCCKSGT